jgi:uncharacterized protein with PIN domain
MSASDPEKSQWKSQDDILSGMREWRQQHPKATFAEIERETMQRMAHLQARIMEEIAQTSQAADWQEGQEPNCPECGAKMRRRGEHERNLQVAGGGEVKLKRAYAVCPVCGAELFPLG